MVLLQNRHGCNNEKITIVLSQKYRVAIIKGLEQIVRTTKRLLQNRTIALNFLGLVGTHQLPIKDS